jgi:hypothetical protein
LHLLLSRAAQRPEGRYRLLYTGYNGYSFAARSGPRFPYKLYGAIALLARLDPDNAIRRVVAGRDPPKSIRTKITAANFERRHDPDLGYTALSGATDYALFNCPTCGVAVV